MSYLEKPEFSPVQVSPVVHNFLVICTYRKVLSDCTEEMFHKLALNIQFADVPFIYFITYQMNIDQQSKKEKQKC